MYNYKYQNTFLILEEKIIPVTLCLVTEKWIEPRSSNTPVLLPNPEVFYRWSLKSNSQDVIFLFVCILKHKKIARSFIYITINKDI